MLQFGMLGPLEVRRDDGSQVALSGVRQRAVVARLLLEPGRVVAADRLIEDVWDGRPPPTANKALQKYVSELRKALVEPVVRTTPVGYLLDVEESAVDACRFEGLVDARRYEEALALWRGDVLSDLGDAAFARPERVRLDELRLFAQEALFDEQLAAGRHAEIVAELTELAETHRLRERLTAQLMLALYRSGRQVEALRAFDRHRRQLAEEVGVEPAVELRELEGAILRQEPSLDLEQPHPGIEDAQRARSRELPLPLTSFVGRATEMAGADRVLVEHRLVTLTGPGGVGKTRLASELAARATERFSGGVRLVDLAGVHSSELVVTAVAREFAVDAHHAPDEKTALLATLAHRPPSLIVLDNCEHLVKGAAEFVVTVLRSCQDVRVLATSRRPLGVDGEYVRPLAPLSHADAVSLFLDRAALAGVEPSEDPNVVEICRRMDGLPLAIELAASQLRVMSTAEIAGRLGDQLRFQRGAVDTSPRQSSLGDMVRWSYELLPEVAQNVLARLGVFASSMTLAAAESVGSGDGVAPADVLGHVTTLVDHSLLQREHGSSSATRYRLLETLRVFALQRLEESGATADAHRAHASFYRQLAEEAAPHLIGPEEALWHTSLDVEEPNFDAALAWAAANDQEMALRLAVALWPHWSLRWQERRGVAYLGELLDGADVDVPDDLHAWALAAAGDMASNPGDARRALPWSTAAVAAFRRLGDEHGLSLALLALGSALGNGGALDEADRALDEALEIARRRNDRLLAARAVDRTFHVATRRGNHALAADLSQSEIEAWQTLGSARGEATARRRRAVALIHFGRLDEAEQQCRRALDIWQHAGAVPASIAHVTLTLADIARLRGEHQQAIALYDEALGDLQAAGDQRCTASTYKNLATIAAASGEHDSATDLFRSCVRMRHDLGDDAGLPECFEGMAAIDSAEGRHESAVELLAASANLRQRTGSQAAAEEAASTAATLDEAKAALGEPTFERAVARGRGRSVEEAVDQVLRVNQAGEDSLPGHARGSM